MLWGVGEVLVVRRTCVLLILQLHLAGRQVQKLLWS